MKKSFTIAKLAAVCLLGGAALSANAAVTLQEIVPGQDFTIGLVTNGTLYYYAPTQDGTLSITTTCPTSGFLYTSMNSDNDEPTSGTVSCNTNASPYEFSVKKGTTYYAYRYAANSYSQYTASATFTPSEDGDDGDDDQYADFQEMQFNTPYSPSSSNPVNLKYTALTEGTLTVTQKGGYDGCMFSGMPASASDYSTMLQSDGGYSGNASSGYILKYSLRKGQTVYCISPNAVTGSLTSITFSWEGVGTGFQQAQVGVKFNPKGEVWEFVPEVSGQMTVTYSAYYFSIFGQNNSPLYTNAAHTSALQPLYASDGANNTYECVYYVEKGESYYFFYESTDTLNPINLDVTIDQVVEKDRTINFNVSKLLPQPGDASWNENIANYGSGFQYLFSPADVKIQSATVSYVTEDNTPVTVNFNASNVSEMEYMGGGWIIRLYETLVNIKANGKGNTYFTVTLNDITYNGEKVEIVVDDVTDAKQYVDINNDEGKVSIQYFIAAQEMALNNELSTWPETIYESWTEGDANGKAVLVFTNPIKTINEATITLGSQTWGAVSGGDDPDPSAAIPYEINNNVLTLDFTKVTLSPGTKSYSMCTIFITGVTDIYGQGMGLPSVDKKLDYSATVAEDPIVTMENGQILQPETNNYALALEAFVLQWAEQTLTPVDAQNMQATLYIGEEEMGPVDVSIVEGEITGKDDCISIDLTEYAGNYGNYMVKIPMGLVKNADGELNPAQIVSCFIYAADSNYVISPEPGEYTTIEDGTLKVTYANRALSINQDAGAILWANNRIPASVAFDTLSITLSELLPGEYSLVVPATYLIIDNEYLNPEIIAEFIITEDSTGINFIGADANGLYNVYNVNGAKVASGNADVVKNLSKGLYIINGKKVLVK